MQTQKLDHQKLREEIDFVLNQLIKAASLKFDLKEIHMDYKLGSIYDKEATLVITEEKDFLELKYFPHRESWCLVAVEEENLDSDGRSLVYQFNVINPYEITVDKIIKKIDEAMFDGFVFV